ncbi:MAG: type II secretion system F family protein [Candidatus Aenigmatarchaeota archaeon]
MRIPFIPFTLEKTLKFSKKLRLFGIAIRIKKFFPFLKSSLFEANFEFDENEYLSIALFTSFFWFLFLSSILGLIALIIFPPKNFIFIIFFSSLSFSFLSFLYVVLYPRLLSIRKIKNLEKNLLFALRHLLIQVKSGVSLFDGMVSISKAGYGLVSEEFNECVRRISTGIPDVEALEEIGRKNPSLYFRRSLWQITNAIRTGADIADTLDNIVRNLAEEQRVMIRRYGSQLNPLAFLYMMFGVILPSLGITLMIILSSFSGFVIQQIFFWFILVFIIIFKFNFLGLVKSRRPSVEIYV